MNIPSRVEIIPAESRDFKLPLWGELHAWNNNTYFWKRREKTYQKLFVRIKIVLVRTIFLSSLKDNQKSLIFLAIRQRFETWNQFTSIILLYVNVNWKPDTELVRRIYINFQQTISIDRIYKPNKRDFSKMRLKAKISMPVWSSREHKGIIF